MTQFTPPADRPASHIIVTAPTRSDILPLRRLFRQALRHDFQYFPPAYADLINRQNNWWRLLLARTKSDRVIVVAKAHRRIIGYAIGSLTPRGNGELYWLYVDPAQRTANIGARLLEATCLEMQRRGAKMVTLVTYDLKDYYLHLGFNYRGKQRIHDLNLDVMEYPMDGHGEA
jgi:ribosomal protein S18 acetylase RimI-like enzyme